MPSRDHPLTIGLAVAVIWLVVLLIVLPVIVAELVLVEVTNIVLIIVPAFAPVVDPLVLLVVLDAVHERRRCRRDRAPAPAPFVVAVEDRLELSVMLQLNMVLQLRVMLVVAERVPAGVVDLASALVPMNSRIIASWSSMFASVDSLPTNQNVLSHR